MKNPKNLITLLLPVASILIVIGFAFFGKPTTTGFTAIEQNPDLRNIDAAVTLKTNPNEIVPENSEIRITLDDTSASMPVKEFIEKTGQKFDYIEGKLDKIHYAGYGYTGNYSYSLNISNFNINRTVPKGAHVLITEIIFNDRVLYRNEKKVFLD